MNPAWASEMAMNEEWVARPGCMRLFQAPFTTYCIDPAAWLPLRPMAFQITSASVPRRRPITAEPAKVAQVPVGWEPISWLECGPRPMARRLAIS